jgi:hypothetical protein
MPPEPDAAGTKGLSVPHLGAGVDLRLTELEGASNTIKTLNTNLKDLQSVLRGFGTSSGNALNNMLKEIKKNAEAASGAVAGVSGTTGPSPSGTQGGPGTGSFSGSGSWFSSASGQAQSVSQRLTGGIASASTYLTGFSNPLVGAGMGTLRFLRDRIATNRNLAIQSGSDLGMVARQQGTNVANVMGQVGQFPGGIMGTPQDLLGLFSNAPSLGASFSFGNQGLQGQGVRAQGMLAGIRQAQMLNPGASVGQLTQDIGGFAANTGAQQQGAYLTGGAYSMIKAGGRQKSLSEWADDIMKWLENLRGGSKKGVPFNYGELMAQYFPGSNIDAWFQANGVPANMKNYWWTYALEKANKGGESSRTGVPFNITPDDTNVAWQRLRSSSELTRTEFNLGSQMTGAYLNKESANRWFNQMFGTAQTSLIPSLSGSKAMSWIQYLPDTIEDMLMSGVEGLAKGMGDVGDIGDSSGGYSDVGGTGLAGLSPNMRSKLGPMLRANSRIRVTSGLRDNAMQKRLKARGYTQVSGGPSAHTRGDAADLGPPSQYPWIMKNARKFGLTNGASQGEPWHVGVGDVFSDLESSGSDYSSPFDIFSALTSSLTDDPAAISTFIAAMMGKLFGKLTSMAGSGTAPKQDFGLFDRLVAASQGTKIGGLPQPTKDPGAGRLSGTELLNWMGGVLGISGPGLSEADTIARNTTGYTGGMAGIDTSRTGSTYKDFFGQVLNSLGVPNTPSNLAKLGALAKFEGGGGTFNPFNSTGGDFSHKFNSVGVENYPDWDTGVAYTMKLLTQDNTSAMRANLQGGGTWADWRNAVTGFYHSWGGPPMPNVSESSANAFLTKQPPGIGDMDSMSYAASVPASRPGAMQFNNVFHINGGGGNSGATSIDMRRTVTMIADRLEDEMTNRMARNN